MHGLGPRLRGHLASELTTGGEFSRRALPKLYQRFLKLDVAKPENVQRDEDVFDQFIADQFPFLSHLEKTYYVFGKPDSLRLTSFVEERLLRHLDDLLCRALDDPEARSEARRLFGFALELAVIRLSTADVEDPNRTSGAHSYSEDRKGKIETEAEVGGRERAKPVDIEDGQGAAASRSDEMRTVPTEGEFDAGRFLKSRRGRAMVRLALKVMRGYPNVHLLSDSDVFRMLRARGWDLKLAEASVVAEALRSAKDPDSR